MGDNPAEMAAEDIQNARDRWAAWMRWWQGFHDVSQNEMAKRLGVTGPALVPLLEAGSTRIPSTKTLILSRKLTGYPLDALLFSDPPQLQPHKR